MLSRKTDWLRPFLLSAALMAEEARRMPIGGQAVIEGVLMKGKDL